MMKLIGKRSAGKPHAAFDEEGAGNMVCKDSCASPPPCLKGSGEATNRSTRKNLTPESNKDKNRDFFSRVYEVVRLVPPGRVTTYGAIARYIGSSQAARMVGWAMNNSHAQDEYVPAHRVINRNGILSGKHHFGGPRVMEELLESEGVEVIEDRVTDFRTLFWDPNAELI